MFTADVDNDGDEDVLSQLPDGAHWIRLVNDEANLRPTGVSFVDSGPVGETGFHKWEATIDLPAAGIARGLTDVELGVFIEDSSLPQPTHKYWGRLLGHADPTTNTARFTVYAQLDQVKLLIMLNQNNVNPFPGGGISIGGDSVLTVHFKQAPNAINGGSQRHQSLILHFEGGPGGHKSAVGAQWSIRAEPPKPSADDELLPWS